MMNATLILDKLDTATPGPQPVQQVETREIVDAVRSCLQQSLAGEAQNFRSWVAAAHMKFKRLQRLALATTAITCLLSLGVFLASLREARRITHQAETQAQLLQSQGAANPAAFAELQRSNWEPTGKLITQSGRTFIELKAIK